MNFFCNCALINLHYELLGLVFRLINTMCYAYILSSITGWYSRKVAGILGTMDMEPFTDFTTASGKHTRNISEVFSAWDVSDDSSNSCALIASSTEMEPEPATTEPSANLQYWCNRIFQFKHSSLQTCFSTVSNN